jgi:hypothetical protein
MHTIIMYLSCSLYTNMTLVYIQYIEMERINDGCLYLTDWEGCALNASLKYGGKFHVCSCILGKGGKKKSWLGAKVFILKGVF